MWTGWRTRTASGPRAGLIDSELAMRRERRQGLAWPTPPKSGIRRCVADDRANTTGASSGETIFMLRNSREGWGLVSQLVHWLVALLILAQILLGLAAVGWHLSPTKLSLFVWHKSVGMLVLVLVLWRLGWRAANPTPALPQGMPRWERLAARGSHATLYVLMLALPVTGWVINSAANIPVKLFWVIPLPDITGPDKRLQEVSTSAHVALFIALAALVAVHIGAALRHHYLRHDDVLRRMLPCTKSPR